MQAVAALSVAVIAMGEEIGSEMCTRIFAQLVILMNLHLNLNILRTFQY